VNVSFFFHHRKGHIMAGYEHFEIIGNVGADPETRFTQSGVQVTNFSVAVTRRWPDAQTGEIKERTKWFRIACWRKLAEVANQFVRKGMQIQVVGKVEGRGYVNNAGQAAASIDVTADSFTMLGSRAQTADSLPADFAPQDDGSLSESIPF
jgi:single-strand DNA-binding protein